MNAAIMAQALNSAMKAVDALKIFQQQTSNDVPDDAARKAEKIACCTTIAENLSLPGVKSLTYFSQVLSPAIKRLLLLCDDADSDIRMLADECLNRIIRSMADSNIVKVQFQLYNMISKNGSSRSLRAALWRFGILSRTIRPMKGKAYISNLVPCIVAISQRSEESVIDTLAQSLPLIFDTLGPFMTDKDVKTLLKAFYPNLSSSQAAFRRNAASMILSTCLWCRKPRYFLAYVLRNLIDCLVPVSQAESNGPLVIGVLGCLRTILPHISAPSDPENDSEAYRLDCLLQIYDLCLHYAKWHTDHNTVNAALETLAQLLQSPEEDLIEVLTSDKGIPSGKTITSENAIRISLGRTSGSTTTTISGDNSEPRLSLFEPETPQVCPNVEKWISESMSTYENVDGSRTVDTPPIHRDDSSTDNREDDESSLIDRSIDSQLIEDGNDSKISSNATEGLLEERSFVTSEKSMEEKILQAESDSSDDVSSMVTASNVPRDYVDIGSVTDADVPLKYACRYLASSFLLTGDSGQLVSDKYFRVSVKSLALTCIGNMLRLYPSVLSATLAKDSAVDGGQQAMADILLFARHSDPQIRGNVAVLVGHYLTATYARCKGNYESMKMENSTAGSGRVVPLESLVDILLKGLEDDSTTACRQTLVALGTCLTDLLESDNNRLGIVVLNKLLRLVDNPYFLVKVQLARVLGDLPYIAVMHVTGNLDFQENVINVLIALLADQDPRIRSAAGEAVIRIVPSLYYRQPNENEVSRKASRYTEQYLSTIISDPLQSTNCRMEYKHLVESLVEPFYSFYADPRESHNRDKLEDALSIIVSRLTEKLLVRTSKFLAYGCCEALCRLSESYATTLYPRAWECFVAKLPVARRETESSGSASHRGNETDHAGLTNDPLTPIGNVLLSMTISILSSSSVSLDLATHRHLIVLAGNIVSGLALCGLAPGGQTPNGRSSTATDSSNLWKLFENETTNRHVESLFVHIARILNIYVHAIDGIELVSPSVKSSLSSLSAARSLSPRKKLTTTSEHKTKERVERGIGLMKIGKDPTGHFFPIPHYMRLYETLKSAHENYNCTLDSEASKMYIALLNASLRALSQIFEIVGTPEASKFADEILQYLQTTLTLSPSATVQCVRQLLKCLFGTNVNARSSELQAVRNPKKLRDNHKDDGRRGLYAQCFQRPVRHMAETIKTMGNNCRGGNEPDAGWSGTLRKREDSKIATVFESLARATNQKSSVTSLIKIFEPMVIQSLKKYTTTGSVEFQCQVLTLLIQLVQLRVNYCLLDTDKIFIGFVLDQFAFIEQAQMKKSDDLLPKIFGFLVRLSYNKYHTKNIIDVPKIIHLCDGLMASGQPPWSHCIPALVPIVEDVFLSCTSSTKNSVDQGELETTREVLMTTMLRLIEYPRVIELLARCVIESRHDGDGNGHGEEKWRRWSRLAIDAILPLLATGKIRIESRTADVALMKLFSAVSPTVFRPVDPLLKVLFIVPPTPEESNVKLKRWLGMVNIVVLSLIAYAKEEAMLARLTDLSVYTTDLAHTLALADTLCNDAPTDPLNATSVHSTAIPPENILSIFIFRVIALAGRRVRRMLRSVDFRRKINSSSSVDDDDEIYPIQQLAFFLQLCIHMFESGSHRKVANATMQMIRLKNNENIPIAELNDLMLDVADACPLLTCQWSYLMTLLDYSQVPFWSKILAIPDSTWSAEFRENIDANNSGDGNPRKSRATGINTRIVQESGTILMCDHVCENLNDVEPLTWLLVKRIVETASLSGEPPVRDLVTKAVHGNPAASGLLVQAIAARCLDLSRPSFVKRLLRCMETAHQSQSGAVIIALVPRFFESKHLALARMAAKIATRRAEILLASSTEEALQQLPRDDLARVMENLGATKLSRKHGTLVGTINKLAVAHYDLPPLILEHDRPFDPSIVNDIRLDRQWFLSQVKLRCCRLSVNANLSESAQLLSKLDPDDCDAILTSREFDLKILIECVRLGARTTSEKFRECEFNGEAKPTEPCPLYLSARECILQKVRNINQLVPKPRQIYDPLSSEINGKIAKYSAKFANFLQHSICWQTLFTIVPAVTCYLTSVADLGKCRINAMEEEYEQELAKFALLCFEASHWMIDRHEAGARTLKPRELELTLNCADESMKNYQISSIFGKENHYSWICSASKSLARLVAGLSINSENPLTMPGNRGLQEALQFDDTQDYATACLEMSGLVCWLENSQLFPSINDIPQFIIVVLKNLIVSVSRQSLVNTFVLTPPVAWKHGWHAVAAGPTRCNFPLLSAESGLLREVDVLRQFVYRATLLGWTSRLQFEEMWMAFLGVLSATPDGDVGSGNDDLDHGVDDGGPEDALENQSTSLAVEAMTRLLNLALLLPCPGNPANSAPIHHPRDPQLALHKKSSQRLFLVQNILSRKYEFVRNAGKRGHSGARLEHLYERGNIERNSGEYAYGQLSILYLWSMCSLHQDKYSSSVIMLKESRDRALEAARLDLGSCLRFLIELYTRWMTPGIDTPPRLLNEVVKSLLSISELFVERSQFQWMLDTCLEISRNHTIENEILHHYLVIAVCKAAAVLAPLDVETLEKVKRSVDTSLKSSFLPARITALHGMLYLLQSAVLANCEETMNVVHPLAIKYIQKHIEVSEENGVLGQSEVHQRIMWTLVFFLLEHADDTPPDAEAPAVLELVLTLVTVPNISTDLHTTLLQGLERLIGTRSVAGRVAEQIVKVAVERLRQTSPLLAMPALQLLLTCMYTESADRFDRPDAEEPLPDIDPETLVRSIERTSVIFDRIKRGYPTEVRVLCAVLSQVLSDFFPPSDILTKVIGEFLSPQQPHQRLLSAVVFKVCERVACNGAQLGLLQDWVVFSLPNFIQSLPLAMSTWCLSCFFISASTNPWLRALFPHVQSRIGKYEYEDKKILCIAASDFYHRLSGEGQKEAFVESFEAAAKELGTPFSDILASF